MTDSITTPRHAPSVTPLPLAPGAKDTPRPSGGARASTVPKDFAALREPGGTVKGRESEWLQSLTRIRELLPIQNPLSAFLHNNMLMAWEIQPFWPAVFQAAGLYGARVPANTEYYRKQYAVGRITPEVLERAIVDAVQGTDQWLACSIEKQPWARWLRLLIERSDLSPAGQIWELAQSSRASAKLQTATSREEPWQIIERVCVPKQPLDELFSSEIHDWLCHSLESFLDQGVSYWKNPYQNTGFLAFLKAWAKSSWLFSSSWQVSLANRLVASGDDSRSEILGIWRKLGLSRDAWTCVCLNLLYTVKGWAGMLNKAETDRGLLIARHPHAMVEDLIFVLLLLADNQGLCLEDLARPWESCERITKTHSLACDDLWAGVAALDPGAAPPSTEDLRGLVSALNALDEPSCRIIWHNAFEQSLHATALQNLIRHTQGGVTDADTSHPQPIVMCCIDDREESLRRHVEATDPTVRTFGVLGNFGLDMRFKGKHDPRPTQQCPPVIAPRRVVYETDAFHAGVSAEPSRMERAGHALAGSRFFAARTLLHGFATSIGIGMLAAIPMALRVLAPRLAQRLASRVEQIRRPSRPGQIALHRHEHEAFGACGYDPEEQAAMVYSILSAIAPIASWPSVVLALGHESHSINNPFLKAYGCGACSGHSGAPNARIFAQMANDPQVRAILRSHGIDLPETTIVIGGVHDTTSDIIRYFHDAHALTERQSTDFSRVRMLLERALALNARERSVLLAGTTLDLKDARRHVARRAVDLAEPRPEYGHSRTFLAVFGRRQLTASMSLDRRSFLISYDQAADVNGDILRGLIHGAMPVVANITLDYLFSRLDNRAFGSGTKLPLNIAGHLGVVTGSRGDLRIGLSQQMVELHEPARSLVLIEAHQARIESAVFSHRRLTNLVSNGWLRMGAIDRQSGEISIWTSVGWRKPELVGVGECLLEWGQRGGEINDRHAVR
jgi:uncharacterized protein YbcC (UPF0753/DUF2309 family)